ncbi:MAG: peptidyl-prolyl cis-trans isomerase [Candidatus Omnitrophota bacterium]
MKKKIFLVCLWIICCFLCVKGYVFAENMDRIAAIVNDSVITEAELALFASMTDIDNDGEMSDNDARNLRKKLLQRMVEDKLILQEAKKLNLIVNERMVEERVEEVKEKAGSQEFFDLALKQQGITLNEFREKLRNQLLVYLAIQHVITEKIKISPKEVTEYYQEHEDKFMMPESALIDSIFVEKKETLDEIQDQLNNGKDFNDLAQKYSQRANLGLVRRGQLKKDLDNFIFSLKQGQCSLPFEFDGGYYIFLLKEKKEASCKPIKEAKSEILMILQSDKMERKLKEWIEELKEKAYISIRD